MDSLNFKDYAIVFCTSKFKAAKHNMSFSLVLSVSQVPKTEPVMMTYSPCELILVKLFE